MKKEELWNYPLGSPPVLLPDGKVGLLTTCPTIRAESTLCGIQVPGEPEHRWYHHDKIKLLGGGALVAEGEPAR